MGVRRVAVPDQRRGQSVADHPGARLPNGRPYREHGHARRAVRKASRRASPASRTCAGAPTHACPSRSWTMSRAARSREITLRENRRDLDAIRFRERVMFDVSNRKLETTMLGEKVAMPRRDRSDRDVRGGLVERRDPFVPSGARFRHPLLAFDQRVAVDRGRSQLGRPGRSGSSFIWKRTAASRRTCSSAPRRRAARC